MREHGLYDFDQADAELSLLPMAARRALDGSGRHLSLATWGTLPREVRARLIALGAAEVVDEAEVVRLLDSARAQTRAEVRVPDVARDTLAADVRALLDDARPLTDAQWSALTALDRYVLVKLASRGKRERFAAAYDEIVRARAR